MKRITIYTFIFLFVASFSATAGNDEIYKYIHLNRENEADYKKERLEWIEDLHRTSPELNWRVIESANHLARIEKHNKILSDYLLSGKTSKDEMLEIIIGESGLRGKWIEKGSNNQSGRMHTADIDFKDRLIYAGSSGGNIWRGSLTGSGWTCLNNGLKIGGIQYIKVFRIGPTKRIVVVGNGPAAVWYTDDEGLHWKRAEGLDKPRNWGSMQRGITVNGSNEIYVLTTEWDYTLKKAILAIYRSDDFAENFKSVKKFNLSLNYCDIWTPEYHNAPVYFIHKDTLSAIRGMNIEMLAKFSIKHNYSKIRQTLLRGSVLNKSIILTMLFKSSNGDSSYVYRTNDMKNWYHIGTSPVRTFMRNSFNVSYTDTSLMFVGGVDLWKSDDNAATWFRNSTWWEYYPSPATILHADIPGILYFKSPQGADLFLIGTDGGLYISKDNIHTVENLSLSGLNVSQYYSGYTYRKSDSIMFLGSQDQGFQRTLNDTGGVADFEQTISGDYGHLSSSDGGNHLWCVYPGFAMLYVGAQNEKFSSYTWSFRKELKNWLWMPPIVPYHDDPKSAYLVSGTRIKSNNNANRVWTLTFNGNKIEYDSLDYDFRQGSGSRKPSALAISPLAPDFLYVLSNDGKFFFSTDRGKKWEMDEVFKGPGGHYFYGNTVVASSEKFGRVYIAGNGYNSPGAYMSDDHGKNWTPIDSGLPRTLIYKIAVTPDDKYIFAATASGPYVYIVDESRWYDMSSPNSPDQTFWSVEYVPKMKTARFVTYGRGAWDFKIESFTTGVSIENEAALSSELLLSPNPLQEQGRVRLMLNKTVSGSLLLYDISGKLVKEVFTGVIDKGETTFLISRYTAEGVKLPQGSYILFLIADGLSNYTQVKIID